MSSKRETGKSVVPRKLQIPLAIILGALFVFLLTARLRGRESAQGAPVPSADGEATATQTATADSQHRVDALIEKINEEEPRRHDERGSGSPPNLVGDPFLVPQKSSARVVAGKLGDRPRSQEEQNAEARARFVESLTLQATLIDGDSRFALIDGTLFAENDSVGAFKIVGIGERSAFLDDGHGTAFLKMKGDDLL
jgi:hypothetical protein